MPGAVLDSRAYKDTDFWAQAATDMKMVILSRLLPGTPDVEAVRNRSSNWKLINVCKCNIHF